MTHTLMVIHTPGHAANHLCLLLLEDGLLFSGDHILNGSTTVVDPPDGDMSAYLDSLDRLLKPATSTASASSCRRTATPSAVRAVRPGRRLPTSKPTGSSERPRFWR
ncbi:MAG: MBL fold metallo-hydrolase [Betaproteobacteria bacterium]|nr:MBL fold metallo-hydrolase [Betaproteobacteria bacterium]